MDDSRNKKLSQRPRHGLRVIRCDSSETVAAQQSAAASETPVRPARGRQNSFVQMMNAYADAIDDQIVNIFDS